MTVRLHDGRELEGTVRRDYRSDLALVKVEAQGLKVARLGDSDRLRIGQWAIAIGNPFRYDGSFSVGVVSALGRRQEIRTPDGGLRLYPRMIQTDAALNPGSSGGPLISIDGEVVGINTAIESENGQGIGIGFAIPVTDVRFVIDQLRERGRVAYGFLGVEPATVTPTLAPSDGVPWGARVVAEPAKETPASEAGIHADDVITAFAGAPIRGKADLRLAVARTAPGTRVEIALVRSGAEKRVAAVLAEAPRLEPEERSSSRGRPGLGILVAETPRKRLRTAAAEGQGGVAVVGFEPASDAAASELREGDVILAVNGQPTPTRPAYQRLDAALQPGQPARVKWRGQRAGESVIRVTVVTVGS